LLRLQIFDGGFLEPGHDALLSLFAFIVFALVVPHVVVLVEHEELELQVEVSGQLDRGREDVHFNLVVDAPRSFRNYDELVFESAFYHGWTAIDIVN